MKKKTASKRRTTAKKAKIASTAKQTAKTKKKQQKAVKAAAAESKKDTENLLDLSQPISFFSTLDTFFESYDYDTILAQIQKKYPQINEQSDDKVLKAEIAALLQDIEFINKILEFYKITFHDFLKLLFSSFAAVFKGQYFKKISKIVNGKRSAYK